MKVKKYFSLKTIPNKVQLTSKASLDDDVNIYNKNNTISDDALEALKCFEKNKDSYFESLNITQISEVAKQTKLVQKHYQTVATQLGILMQELRAYVRKKINSPTQSNVKTTYQVPENYCTPTIKWVELYKDIAPVMLKNNARYSSNRENICKSVDIVNNVSNVNLEPLTVVGNKRKQSDLMQGLNTKSMKNVVTKSLQKVENYEKKLLDSKAKHTDIYNLIKSHDTTQSQLQKGQQAMDSNFRNPNIFVTNYKLAGKNKSQRVVIPD